MLFASQPGSELTDYLVELGTPACSIVAISTGRNTLAEATIKLTAPSGVEFSHDQASLVDSGGCIAFENISSILMLRVRWRRVGNREG